MKTHKKIYIFLEQDLLINILQLHLGWALQFGCSNHTISSVSGRVTGPSAKH